MKTLAIIFTFLFTDSNSSLIDKVQLVCHKWHLVGEKQDGGKYLEYSLGIQTNNFIFNNDGTYQYDQDVYGLIIEKGTWTFNVDSSTLNLNVKELERENPKSIIKSNQIREKTIVRLSIDTLILGEDQNGGSTHFESYYKRVK